MHMGIRGRGWGQGGRVSQWRLSGYVALVPCRGVETDSWEAAESGTHVLCEGGQNQVQIPVVIYQLRDFGEVS